jgi:hypothetical protein
MSRKSPIQKRLAPSVPLELRVKDSEGNETIFNLKLVFDFNAYALVETHAPANVPINMLRPDSVLPLVGDPQGKGATIISLMLWAALNAYHADDFGGEEGLEAIRSFLSYDNLEAVTKAVLEAFLLSLPESLRKPQEGQPDPNALAAPKSE